ncbi:Immunoglobulin-like fold containing protein [Parasponia andersonii]|uniref:Immunoglobulin-like fold containing protein n=1 Tax=Parasponia andersonii TaxID=3476 RepID=A0A2P5APJ5_PARAD|nr:Immunoglobulin-like fold containing protein [Parasponia andersonii]
MSTLWKTSLNLERPPSSIQIARILRRVPFESEKPFFKVLMQPSYVGSRGMRDHVPLDFAMRHIKNEGDVVLSVPNVSIVHFAEYVCLQWSQAGDYTTGASMPKGT